MAYRLGVVWVGISLDVQECHVEQEVGEGRKEWIG